jgi:hypothetical protein
VILHNPSGWSIIVLPKAVKVGEVAASGYKDWLTWESKVGRDLPKVRTSGISIASVIDSGVASVDQVEPTEMPFLSRRGVRGSVNWVWLFVTFHDKWDPMYAGYASTILHLRRFACNVFFPFFFFFFFPPLPV